MDEARSVSPVSSVNPGNEQARAVVLPTWDGGPVALRYDDTYEGLLSALFDSYSHKPPPVAVVGLQHQQALGTQYIHVETDGAKASRVIDGITRRMGHGCYEQIWTAFLSHDPDKGNKIYRYVRLGMKIGGAVTRHLANGDVIAFNELAHLVNREAMHQKQFLRFSRVDAGAASIYYAKITPANDITAALMPFFVNRFRVQPFIIHDEGRQLAGVYDAKEWYITEAGGLTLPDGPGDEYEYRRLWKRFYDSVAIKERTNHRLRRQHMPKAFWKNMTEMAMLDTAPPTLLPTDVSQAAVRRSLIADREAAEALESGETATAHLPAAKETPPADAG